MSDWRCESCCYFQCPRGNVPGSSVANTVGSGSITIPVMKKTGYDKDFAAAVEAAASLGADRADYGAAAFDGG